MPVLFALVAVGILGPSDFLRGMIDSDRALSRNGRLHGLAVAYQRVFSTDSMVLTTTLESGDVWLRRQEFAPTDKLFWDMNRAEISSQGEFGYTSGAWTLKRNKTYTNGDFVRVWKKQGKEWKIVFEADTTTDLPRVATGQVSAPKRKGKLSPPTEDVQRAISENEAKLSADTDASKCYLEDAYILRSNVPPVIGFTGEASTVGRNPVSERFLVDRPADLACSFGLLDTKDGQAPFLRIWRRTAGNAWKITLEYVGSSQHALGKEDHAGHSEDEAHQPNPLHLGQRGNGAEGDRHLDSGHGVGELVVAFEQLLRLFG